MNDPKELFLTWLNRSKSFVVATSLISKVSSMFFFCYFELFLECTDLLLHLILSLVPQVDFVL